MRQLESCLQQNKTMGTFTWLDLGLITLLQFQYGECLDCYECSNITTITDCHTIGVCQADHVCSALSTSVNNNIRFNLGCRHKDQCPIVDSQTTTVSPVSIVGRDVTSQSCDQCCAADGCNKHMCIKNQIQTDPACADDPTFNCAQFSSAFNLCADRHHAKTVCRKYCGLCDLFDGAWSNWSSWSSCDVTCGNGTSTRLRICDNPAPANGGLPCSGNNLDKRQCSLDACPVHGGWSPWTEWGSCSTSCGMGLKIKTRTCSNPYPSRFGDHCFGDTTYFQACFQRACTDGGWSSWSTWSTCSSTCNGGMKSRQRSCSNPGPSKFGQSCVGNNEQKDICNTNPCTTHHVAFTVHSPNGTLVGDSSPIFSTIVTNVGGGYNQSTGIFTCPVSGLYLFSVTVGTITTSSKHETYCNLYHDNLDVGYVGSFTNATGYNQGSETVYVEMHVGDIFRLQCYNWSYVHKTTPTVFSGALISS